MAISDSLMSYELTDIGNALREYNYTVHSYTYMDAAVKRSHFKNMIDRIDDILFMARTRIIRESMRPSSASRTKS